MATLYAQTSSGRVYIDDFDKGVHNDPSCFTCDGRLVAKKGQLKTHHFAHRSKEECEAWNDSGMTEWHKNWQLLVPEECREVRMTRDGKTHIADIQLPTGEVVEIQHSPITVDEGDLWTCSRNPPGQPCETGPSGGRSGCRHYASTQRPCRVVSRGQEMVVPKC